MWIIAKKEGENKQIWSVAQSCVDGWYWWVYISILIHVQIAAATKPLSHRLCRNFVLLLSLFHQQFFFLKVFPVSNSTYANMVSHTTQRSITEFAGAINAHTATQQAAPHHRSFHRHTSAKFYYSLKHNMKNCIIFWRLKNNPLLLVLLFYFHRFEQK